MCVRVGRRETLTGNLDEAEVVLVSVEKGDLDYLGYAEKSRPSFQEIEVLLV